MRHKDFNIKEHGFVGHLAEPDVGSDRAVIVIMGGEQSILPGIKFAERFADYGITGLSVSLFGAEGLPDAPNQVPLDMFIPAVEYLREKKGIEHISVYGQSMGSIFAVLVAQYIGGMENLIMVSPTHVPFEGTAKDKKTMTGRSVATFKAEDIPFISADFSKIKAAKYYKHPDVEYKVTGMRGVSRVMTDSQREWVRARDELVREIKALGFPEELGSQIAKQLGSPKAMSRMMGYLVNVRPRSAELIVDEMLAICSDIDRWKDKKANEEANARYNELLYYGLSTDE